jgi:hypothetical protein
VYSQQWQVPPTVPHMALIPGQTGLSAVWLKVHALLLPVYAAQASVAVVWLKVIDGLQS